MTRETEPTPKAVVVPVEAIVRDIAEQLAASIAGLGFPVGMGKAPPEEMCLRAARGIVALYGRSLAALTSEPKAEGEGPSHVYGIATHLGSDYAAPQPLQGGEVTREALIEAMRKNITVGAIGECSIELEGFTEAADDILALISPAQREGEGR